MRKILWTVALAIVAGFSAIPSFARTGQEAELVRIAEEIAASGMDDDEKIERLTEIRARVVELRRRNAVEVAARPPTDAGKAAESPRPVSTYVRNEVRNAMLATEERTQEVQPPGILVRIGYFLLRAIGTVMVLGLGAGMVFTLYLALIDFCERSKRPRLALFGFRQRMKLLKFRVDLPSDVRNPTGVARDGIVPARLR